MYKCLLQILLNQSVTVSVFLYWFKFTASRMLLFAATKTALVILPFVSAGFLSLTVRLLLKFSLWCFRIIKLLLASFISNRFCTSLLFKIRFPSISIFFSMLSMAFLYFEVMALFIIWLYSIFLVGKGLLFSRWKWLNNYLCWNNSFCLNRLKFLADVSNNLQKGTTFGNLRIINIKFRQARQFFSYFLSLLFESTFWVCGIHFCLRK